MSDPYWPERRVGYEDNVWYGLHKATGDQVVMKLFERERFSDGPVRDEQVLAEVKIIKDLSAAHPERIIRFLDFYSNDEDQLVLVMERAECSLQDILCDIKFMPEMAAREAVFGMLEGVACVHSASLVHRDIKPANLMLMDRTDTSSIKLGDFGVAVGNVGYDSLNQMAGTMGYQAPEMLSHSFYGKAVDIWSCGVVAYQLLYGRLPFKPTTGTGIFATKKIGPKQQLDAIKKGLEFDSANGLSAVSDVAKDFIRKLLQADPTKRPKIKEAMEHPWFGHGQAKTQTELSTKSLPDHPGWMVVEQPDGEPYYFNQKTHETTWNPPFQPSLPSRPRPRSASELGKQVVLSRMDSADRATPDSEVSNRFENLRDPDKLMKAKSHPNMRNPFHEEPVPAPAIAATTANVADTGKKRSRHVQFNNMSEVIHQPPVSDDEEEEEEEEEALDAVREPVPEPIYIPAPASTKEAGERRRRETIAQMYGHTKASSATSDASSDHRRRETISQMYGATGTATSSSSRTSAKSTLDAARARGIVGKLETTASKYKDRFIKFASKKSTATKDAGLAPPAPERSPRPIYNPLPLQPQPRSSSFATVTPAASPAAEATYAPPLPTREHRFSAPPAAHPPRNTSFRPATPPPHSREKKSSSSLSPSLPPIPVVASFSTLADPFADPQEPHFNPFADTPLPSAQSTRPARSTTDSVDSQSSSVKSLAARFEKVV
ncbi:kinase-like domain-containing protein [Powellomyces hirtus]|nr:kinase-like domain-containing protein [Powellomyces hirtus]